MATVKKNSKKITELLNKLHSSESKEVIKAVKSLKVNGNENVIEPLINCFVNSSNNVVKNEIEDLLNSIKSTKVPAKLIKCLVEPKYSKARQMMLSSIWNSNLDYTNYLTEIVNAAQQGDMMDAMECLTILENMEGTLNEDKIMDPLVNLKSYLVENATENTPKMGLLREVTMILTEINESL